MAYHSNGIIHFDCLTGSAMTRQLDFKIFKVALQTIDGANGSVVIQESKYRAQNQIKQNLFIKH